MNTYITTLKNEGKKPVIVFEHWGPMIALLPGDSKTIEADTADAMYAPCERVVWNAASIQAVRLSDTLPNPSWSTGSP